MRGFFHIIFSTEKTGAIAAALFHLLCKTDNLETIDYGSYEIITVNYFCVRHKNRRKLNQTVIF